MAGLGYFPLGSYPLGHLPSDTVAYIGFQFGGGGGLNKINWKSGSISRHAARGDLSYAFTSLGGLGACSPEKVFKNGAICCVLENILLKFCKNKIGKIFIFLHKNNR